jgi:hypothetical protein
MRYDTEAIEWWQEGRTSTAGGGRGRSGRGCARACVCVGGCIHRTRIRVVSCRVVVVRFFLLLCAHVLCMRVCRWEGGGGRRGVWGGEGGEGVRVSGWRDRLIDINGGRVLSQQAGQDQHAKLKQSRTQAQASKQASKQASTNAGRQARTS